MLTKLDTCLVKSESCFRRYLKHLRFDFEYSLNKYKYIETPSHYDFEVYVNCALLVSLWYTFDGLLSKEEKVAIEYYTRHNEWANPPINYDIDMNYAYQKWIDVFFKNKMYKENELNPCVIGLIMKYIRETNHVKKTRLAGIMGVDRNTVLLIEKGSRLPSLNYTYRFCKLFNVSVDDVVDYYRFMKIKKEQHDDRLVDIIAKY